MREKGWTLEEHREEYQRLSQIPKSLLDWYEKNRRILPWREEPTPYRVWVSEIMLQQTRVEAGRDYFLRFVRELPHVEALANVTDQQLMKLWEGLGYYSRARNLKKAAGVVMEQYGGVIPGDFDQLLKLPGVGPYTAGAIASIAFGLPVPAVDGNVLRVLSRVLASEKDIASPAVKRDMELMARGILPKDRPGDFNQALMELGAIVCLPNGAPHCGECPVHGLCLAKAGELWEEIPVKKGKKERRIEEKTMLILLTPDEEKAALQKRPEKGLLAGLNQLPNVEGQASREQVQSLLSQWGVEAQEIRELLPAKHIFSHVEWRMSGYRIVISPKSAEKPEQHSRSPLSLATSDQELIWVNRRELKEDYALPSAFRAFREQIWK